MQSFPGDALRTPVVWNSITSACLLKALTYPNQQDSLELSPSVQAFKPNLSLNLIFIMKTGNMVSDKKLMTEN